MPSILMTTVFYKALILQGEIWYWSLLGLKELRPWITVNSEQEASVFRINAADVNTAYNFEWGIIKKIKCKVIYFDDYPLTFYFYVQRQRSRDRTYMILTSFWVID